MKILKFKNHLAEMVMSGEKINTWRFFDEKNLSLKDEVVFINKDTGKEFAKAIITSIYNKKFKEINIYDLEGHEKFKNKEEMFETYKGYYGYKLNWETLAEVIRFKLV